MPTRPSAWYSVIVTSCLIFGSLAVDAAADDFANELSNIPYKIVYETWQDDNWELFAASAYLSDDPKLIGSLRGQDFGKIFAMGFIVIGSVTATVNGLTGGSLDGLMSAIHSFFARAAG